jgi:hypothetical protein
MSVQTNIADGYLSAFEGPVGVSVMSKLTQWPFLQQLGFAGTLDQSSSTFHGLKDFTLQMNMYSSTNGLLKIAWNIIKQFVLNNAQVKALEYQDPNLGSVGLAFKTLTSSGQVFALSPSELQSPGSVAMKVASVL